MKLKCKKCGEEIEGFSKLFDAENGKTLNVELKQLPFGLCPDCFREEYVNKPDAAIDAVTKEIHRIAIESVAQSCIEKGIEGTVFDYNCPECGVMAVGIGTEEQYKNALELKPVCPECRKKREARETSAADQQSFSM